MIFDEVFDLIDLATQAMVSCMLIGSTRIPKSVFDSILVCTGAEDQLDTG